MLNIKSQNVITVQKLYNGSILSNIKQNIFLQTIIYPFRVSTYSYLNLFLKPNLTFKYSQEHPRLTIFCTYVVL